MALSAVRRSGQGAVGRWIDRRPSDNGKLAALVFKTISDPYIGRLTFVRVYSGTLSADSHVWNAAKNRDERVGQIFTMRGKQQEPTPRIGTGDIGVIPKLAETSTGDTLTTREAPIELARHQVPDSRLLRLDHPEDQATSTS